MTLRFFWWIARQIWVLVPWCLWWPHAFDWLRVPMPNLLFPSSRDWQLPLGDAWVMQVPSSLEERAGPMRRLIPWSQQGWRWPCLQHNWEQPCCRWAWHLDVVFCILCFLSTHRKSFFVCYRCIVLGFFVCCLFGCVFLLLLLLLFWGGGKQEWE